MPSELARALGVLSSTWHRLSLARQLFLAMFTAVVIVASVNLFYDNWLAGRRLEAMERSTMEAVSPLMQRLVEDAMSHRSRQRIGELFAAMGGRGVPEKMFLLDSEKLGVDTDDFKTNRPPRRFQTPEFSRRTTLTMDFPLYSRPGCVQCHSRSKPVIGYVRLVSPHAEKARALAAQAKSHLASMALMALMLGFWAMLVVRSMVERPLGRIMSAMDAVRSGQLDTRVSPVPEGEFGSLAAGFNAMIEDIDRDRRKIIDLHRRQVAHMERLVSAGELAAHLAHEIRNPLTGISTAIQVMQNESPEGHPRREILQKILAQLSRMDHTMSNFLRYARLPETEVRPYDIQEAMQHVFFLLDPRLKAQKIELRRRVDPNLPKLVGDLGQIEQVLLNLCLNAIQAMPSGRLTVAARREGREVKIEISDQGHGIPHEQLDRIFEPFFTTRENGSGLGLPISRQIIGAHGGELWIESVVGQGTTAHIRLPAQNGAGR